LSRFTEASDGINVDQLANGTRAKHAGGKVGQAVDRAWRYLRFFALGSTATQSVVPVVGLVSGPCRPISPPRPMWLTSSSARPAMIVSVNSVDHRAGGSDKPGDGVTSHR
jgi:hypothetical protein